MAWYWRFQPDLDGSVPADGFTSQSAAESWLSGNYAELADAGVQAVALYEETRLVYGPMSLAAE